MPYENQAQPTNEKIKKVCCALLWKISIVLLFALQSGCEKKVVKFTIISQNGETHFAVPAEIITPCCHPDKENNKFASLEIDTKKLGGNGYYHLTLRSNGNNNAMIRKVLPERIEAAKEVPSDFPGYKKYIEHDFPQGGFLLAGQDKSGAPLYLQCANNTHPRTKCTYFGIYDEKISYEFSFPIVQISDIEKHIAYAKNETKKLIIKE